ncbi:MAG: asparagine synthase (glutamine-hydrolyzing) [Candidatus Komeilibacteria bacterium]|nr:asparagine synthase (glutamine-hydrolyzing) [Candidatus Komeilibacteria bacterium]
MCGIAGYLGEGNQDILEKMTDSLYHRGPDDKGFLFEGKLGLGHRRLSIIDLSQSGRQPMSNEDGSIQIVLNGEIYNYKELRKKLKQQHKFKSQTDTEIIIHLYEEIGTEVFKHLNGMFAIALYDKRQQKLFLARDRMGKKPLYWGKFDNTLIFASELKALAQHPSFKKEISLEALNKYLRYEYVPTPYSIFKNVYKLEPGYYLEYNGQDIKKEKFWDISFNKSNLNFDESLKQLDEKINQATKIRLMSDVPLGIFLSGGIDSSLVAYYAQKNSKQKIKTFSIGFKEKSFDESNYARQVAKYLGTDHHERILSAKDSLEFIPQIADLLDEPMADPSIVPTYLLSKFTKQNVTVALGGDGGDELFMGYDTFVAQHYADIYDKVPKFLRDMVAKTANLLPTSFDNISLDFKLKKFTQGFEGNRNYRHHRWLGSFDYKQKEKLFKQDIWQELKNKNEFTDIDNYLDGLDENNYYDQLTYLYLKTYLIDDILVKVDRASMFNSLEVRAPLLDYNVVDFANSLPVDFKLKGRQSKYILKKLMEGKLPDNIIYRKKKGFGMPMAEWLSGDLKPLALKLLSKERVERAGLFNYKYIEILLNDHFERRRDNRKLIWTLMVFEMWREKWFN